MDNKMSFLCSEAGIDLRYPEKSIEPLFLQGKESVELINISIWIHPCRKPLGWSYWEQNPEQTQIMLEALSITSPQTPRDAPGRLEDRDTESNLSV